MEDEEWVRRRDNRVGTRIFGGLAERGLGDRCWDSEREGESAKGGNMQHEDSLLFASSRRVFTCSGSSKRAFARGGAAGADDGNAALPVVSRRAEGVGFERRCIAAKVTGRSKPGAGGFPR